MARDLRQKFTWVDADAATPHDGEANGDSYQIITGHLQEISVQIDAVAFVATVKIQVKLFSDYAYDDFATVTGPGITKIDVPAERVKLVISGYASGTVNAGLAGFNVQPG